MRPVLMNFCQSNTCSIDASQLYFNDGLREATSEGPTLLHTHTVLHIPTYGTYPSSNWKHQPRYDHSIQFNLTYLMVGL